MKTPACVLAINGGSSSIRFAVYEAGPGQRMRLAGKIDRIGGRGPTLTVTAPAGKAAVTRRLVARDHAAAVDFLLGWLETQPGDGTFGCDTAEGPMVRAMPRPAYGVLPDKRAAILPDPRPSGGLCAGRGWPRIPA